MGIVRLDAEGVDSSVHNDLGIVFGDGDVILDFHTLVKNGKTFVCIKIKQDLLERSRPLGKLSENLPTNTKEFPTIISLIFPTRKSIENFVELLKPTSNFLTEE